MIKKFLAREYILLIGSVIIFFIIYLPAVYLINDNRDGAHEYRNEIRQNYDTEETPYRIKVYYLILNERDLSHLAGRYKLSEFIVNISDKTFFNNFFSGFNPDISTEEIYKKIIDDSISETYIENINNIEDKIAEIENSFFYKLDEDILAEGLILTLLIMVFVLRYFYYITRWSINQLKNT